MTDTLAHRHMFGVLIPDMNSVVQPEFDRLRPAGVTNQVMRYTPGPENLSSDLIERAKQLLTCGPDSLILGLTTDALPGGLATLARVADDLAAATGLSVTTGSAANFAALRTLGAERVALLTPFNDQTNETVRAGYEAEGFTVTDIKGPGLSQPGGHRANPARRDPRPGAPTRSWRRRCHRAGRHRPARGRPDRRHRERNRKTPGRLQRGRLLAGPPRRRAEGSSPQPRAAAGRPLERAQEKWKPVFRPGPL